METKQRLTGRKEKNKKQKTKKGGQKPVILLHTQAITETKSSLGGEIRERQEERASPRKPRKQNL